MNESDLVIAWSFYKRWLEDCDQRMREHRRQLTYAEWLHMQFDAVRKEAGR